MRNGGKKKSQNKCVVACEGTFHELFDWLNAYSQFWQIEKKNVKALESEVCTVKKRRTEPSGTYMSNKSWDWSFLGEKRLNGFQKKTLQSAPQKKKSCKIHEFLYTGGKN